MFDLKLLVLLVKNRLKCEFAGKCLNIERITFRNAMFLTPSKGIIGRIAVVNGTIAKRALMSEWTKHETAKQ